MKKQIAVIGQGFVGGALAQGMAHAFEVHTYDKGDVAHHGHFKHDSLDEMRQALESSCRSTGVYFVCVPTPMRRDGSVETKIVDSVLREIAEFPDIVAVVESTVPPGTTDFWNHDGMLPVVFNPEFLTEANAVQDFANETRIILGGPRPHIDRVKNVYSEAFPKAHIIKTSSTTAEFVKYFTNVQLATRVVLSCEIQSLCQAFHGVDYDKVVEYASYDPRLGTTHMSVPGKDGVPGARGHCFPKDLCGLIAVARSQEVDATVMEAVWRKNLKVVPLEHRDWEAMKGRAVVDDET